MIELKPVLKLTNTVKYRSFGSMMTLHICMTLCVYCMLTSVSGDPDPVSNKCSVNYKIPGCVLVNCTSRGLSKMPTGLPKETCILLASHNHIKSISGVELKHYPGLMELILSNNTITHIDHDAFKAVGEMLRLYLDNNKLSFPNVPSGIFKPLRKLKTLTLHKNKLNDYVDKVLSDLTSLEDLHLDGFVHQTFGMGYRRLTRLQKLTLSGDSGRCIMTHLTFATFENVDQLRMLNISHCDIEHVDEDAFEPLSRIEVLDMSRNHNLGLERLQNITYGCKASPIRILYLNEIQHSQKTCSIVTSDDIRHLKHTNLTEIHASSNRLSGFSPNALGYLPKSLKYAYLLDNRFMIGPYINDLEKLTGLEELKLNGKTLKHYITFGTLLRALSSSGDDTGAVDDALIQDIHQQCKNQDRGDDNTPVGAFHILDSGVQCIASDENVTLRIPPKLKKLQFTYSELSFVLSEIHFGENELEMINISSNVLTAWHGPIYGLNNLTYLCLSNNIAQNVSKVFFSQMTSLIHLDISSNLLGKCISNDVNGEIFGNLRKLQHLDLSLNRISILQKDLFKGLTSLRKLLISQNQIFNLSVAFRFSEQLRLLKADRNQLKWPRPEDLSLFDKLRQNHTLEVDLSSNPFICSCDLWPFVKWLERTSVNVINRTNYVCMYSNKDFGLDSDTLKDELTKYCDPLEHFGLAMGTLAGMMLLLSTIFSAIAYRYRWKLSYWYYAAKLRFRSSSSEGVEFDFDAFVSYAEENKMFVVEGLIPKLEGERGLRLNIHNRDFRPGKSIAENIIDAVQRSRKTILLLSKDFLQSSWCRYELQMANMEQVSSGRDVLLIVLLEEVPCRDIPPEIMYQIHNHTYLEYPQEDQRDTFWTTLSLSVSAD